MRIDGLQPKISCLSSSMENGRRNETQDSVFCMDGYVNMFSIIYENNFNGKCDDKMNCKFERITGDHTKSKLFD